MLFSKLAVDAKKQKMHRDISLTQPISIYSSAFILLVVIIVIAIFLSFSHYTESQRQNLWQKRYNLVIKSDIRLGKLQISFDAITKLLFGIESIIVIYLAAPIVISGYHKKKTSKIPIIYLND